MNIQSLISLAENKLTVLNQAVVTAQQQGDTAALARLELEVVETQGTIDSLKSL